MKFNSTRTLFVTIALILFLTIGLMFNYGRNKLKSVLETASAIAAQISAQQSEISSLQSEVLSVRTEVKDFGEIMSATVTKAIENTLAPKERLWEAPNKRLPVAIPRSERIAHAGGALNGETYTNSIEALEANKGNFTLFEIDLAFTSDDHLVCSHDWDHYPIQIFGKTLDTPPSLAEFVDLTKQNERFTNCTLDTLIEWLDQNPGASIITDLKQDNLKALKYIADTYPNHIHRFKPQIYHMNQYQEARRLGYDDVILTIYNWTAPDDQIVEATRGVKLFAVTVPHFRAPFIAKKLKMAGNRVYAHTINTNETLNNLRWFEVDEVYTDFLVD